MAWRDFLTHERARLFVGRERDFDSYCDLYFDDFVCSNTFETGNVCVEAPGAGGPCVL